MYGYISGRSAESLEEGIVGRRQEVRRVTETPGAAIATHFLAVATFFCAVHNYTSVCRMLAAQLRPVRIDWNRQYVSNHPQKRAVSHYRGPLALVSQSMKRSINIRSI